MSTSTASQHGSSNATTWHAVRRWSSRDQREPPPLTGTIDRLRFEGRKKRVDAHADSPLTVTAPSGPHEALDVSEQGRRLRHALQALTPEERQAIETAFFSELTYSEAAAKLNQPLGTVKTRIRSGLGKLRQALGGT